MRTGGLVGWSAPAYKGTENGIEDSTTHTGTHVVGSNNVSITSRNDTNLIGSTISGKSVTANVGNNLTVESLQDSQIYHETSKSKGLSISGANFISQPTINGVNVKGNIDSTYTSVTEQTGIHAGSGGMNLTVGNTTTVKGATITSKATPEKNKISTKSLVMEDIHNEASYKAKESGIAMNTSGLTAKGVLGKINPLGLSPVVSIPVSDEAQSTTKSAISNNILVEVERKPLTAINRDTEHALNSIKPIFDKADVKERMEYVNAVSDEGFKLIGDIAMKQAQKYEEKAANTSDEALKKRYQKEADKWKDGGIYKVALHGGFGAVVSNMAGGSSLEGFTVASANEIMVGAIAKELAKHPNSTVDANGKYVDNSDVYKIASAVLGSTVSHSSLGTGISLSATQNNYLTHEQEIKYKKEYALAKTDEERAAVDLKWMEIDKQQTEEVDLAIATIRKQIIQSEIDEHDLEKKREFIYARNEYLVSNGYSNALKSISGKGVVTERHVINVTYHKKKLGAIDLLVLDWTKQNEMTAKSKLKNKGINPDDIKNIDLLADEYIKIRDTSLDLIGLVQPGLASSSRATLLTLKNSRVYKSYLGRKSAYKVQGVSKLSSNTQEILKKYENHDWKGKPPNIKGELNAGQVYRNKDGILPIYDKQGNIIKYKEYDINPKKPDASGRDAERFVRGTDESVYYTSDHYKTFIRIK